MPLYKTIKVNNNTYVLIWKIEESFDTLLEGITLTQASKDRVNNMKSDIHRRGFLSIRHILKVLGYNDSDVTYDDFGKPYLNDGKSISITHSFNFCGLIISSENTVGIDIEMQRDKIIKIAHKFTPTDEYKNLPNKDLIRKLTIVWGAKESLYKIYGKKLLNFKEHIYIENFNLQDERTTGEIRYKNQDTTYFISFIEFEGFTCVYAF